MSRRLIGNVGPIRALKGRIGMLVPAEQAEDNSEGLASLPGAL